MRGRKLGEQVDQDARGRFGTEPLLWKSARMVNNADAKVVFVDATVARV
jgi:hypothetical protein